MRNFGKSEATIAEYEWLAKRYLKDWLDVPLRKLTDAMVSKRHDAIGKRTLKGHKGEGGPYAANKTMRLLRAVWNTARRKSEKTLGASPTDAVDTYKETRRQSALPLAHLPTWFKEVKALRAKGGMAALRADLYLLAILSGLRRRSLTTIEREHINRRVPNSIYIPKPKGGEDRAFDVPLSDAAKAIVQRVLKGHNGKWLFPSDESKSGHIEDPRAQPGEFTPWKDAARKKVAFTLHGLRASYISAAHAAGVSDRHAKLLANHAVHKSDVHGGYILAEADALREAQQRITDYLRQHGLPL
jgi:integrase